jgi:hypothetical protein
MAAYLISSGVISPQETTGGEGFPGQIREVAGNRLRCLEPEYRELLPPLQLRRMPRILKMGLASAQLCLNRAGNPKPDAIIVGTGLGCLESLEKFLIEVLTTQEHVTSVLPFINSTHNAVAAQIAMLLHNHAYNLTYCHRSLSFESALLDALLHLDENKGHVLVGGIDECTDDYIKLHSYLNYWKDTDSNLSLLEGHGAGTIAGEGSAFFLLSGDERYKSAPSVVDVHTFFTPGGTSVQLVAAETDEFLKRQGLTRGDISVLLAGINGDEDFDRLYHDLAANYLGSHTGIAFYKHLCGEYYTSSAFGMWVASVILQGGSVPQSVCLKAANGPLTHVLVYTHYKNSEHALILMRHGL